LNYTSACTDFQSNTQKTLENSLGGLNKKPSNALVTSHAMLQKYNVEIKIKDVVLNLTLTSRDEEKIH
jgi:hypothetical protein